MNDLEITRLCAEAMGVFNGAVSYQPLHDDAQAMALVKKFRLQVFPHGLFEAWIACDNDQRYSSKSEDLNLAICECVAKMQAAKGKP